MLRRLLDRFLVAVDSEGVALFQWVFYLTFILIGFHDLFIAHGGPLTLHGRLVAVNLQLWCWLNMIGPGVCLLGKAIKKRAPLARASMGLRLTGDLTINFALLSYIAATFHVEPWGKGGYGGYVATATWLSTLLLITRDIRRLMGKTVAP